MLVNGWSQTADTFYSQFDICFLTDFVSEFLGVGTTLCARVLKCLLPTTVVPQEAVVRAVVWLGVGKIPIATQVSANDLICISK